MEELEMELKAITGTVDELVSKLKETPKRSNEYNYLIGKLEAYTDVQNMLMLRLNLLRKEK